MRGKEYPVFKSADRKNLEWLVKECVDDAFISFDRGRELLGFRYTEQMREWFGNYEENKQEN